MKPIFQFIIVLFVIGSLFIIKDDLKPAYQKVRSYLESALYKASTSIEGLHDDPRKINTGTTENTVTTQEVTPGPLNALGTVFNSPTRVQLSAKAVIALTNKERADNGNLSALKESSKLNASAALKVKDMFALQYFEHESPKGVRVGDLGAEVGYEYIIIGENLALGNFASDKALVDAWMASPGHRANILNSHYSDIGVAVGYGMYQGKNVWLAVQHFALPKGACPAADDALRVKIQINQDKAQTMEADLKLRRERIESGGVYEGKTTNEQIKEYNSLVEVYNNLVITIKQQIDSYNIGIRAYNSCIAEHTGK